MSDFKKSELSSLTPEQKRRMLKRMLARRVEERLLPLSYGQKALWFIHRLSPESPAYNINLALSLEGRVERKALESAVEALALRHPILCTVYTEVDGVPMQQVRSSAKGCLSWHDAHGLGEAELKVAVEAEAWRPFNLEVEYPFRVHLFEHKAGAILLISVHHIATDLLSSAILMDELRKLYEAEVTKVEAKLKEQRYSYIDYVRAQEEFLSSERGAKLFAYWKQQLSGRLPNLYLPTDRPRPKLQTYCGSLYQFQLDDLAARLVEVAARHNCTLYVLLLAVFHLLLYRYSGQEDLLVGSPFAGRTDIRFNDVVGYFVNPVVIRAHASGGQTFTQFLAQVRKHVLEALEHQEYPFPLLVERLQPYRDATRSPIFQTSFVFDRLHGSHQELAALIYGDSSDCITFGSLKGSVYPLQERTSQFDLTLTVVERKGRLSASLKYNTDLFDGTTIERMAGHYRRLLEAVLENADRQLLELPMLSEQEHKLLIYDWNSTHRPYPYEDCIHKLFERQAERTPDALAVKFKGRSCSYSELNALANRLAARLQSLGVEPEVPVAICLERSIEMVVAVLGVLKAGGCYVPIDPSYPERRIDFMLTDCQAQVVVTQRSYCRLLRQGISHVYLEDGLEEAATVTSRVQPHNTCYILYTSGSTGRPKGAMIPHRALCNHMYWIVDTFGIGAQDRLLQKTPFSFDASVWEFYAPLITGGVLVMAEPRGHQDPDYLIDAIEREQITLLQLVPSQLEMLLSTSGLERISSLRHLFCGGEALSCELVHRLRKQLPDILLTNLYGPTEATIDSTYHTCGREQCVRTVSIGRPIANARVYLLNSAQQPVPVGVQGELYIGGVGLGSGYYNRPQLTAERFVPDPFLPGETIYRTGDLGRLRRDGTIEYLGRVDHQVKIRGYRIELGEIEAALLEEDEIVKAVVLDYELGAGDRRLVAFVVCEGKLNEERLRDALRTKLPDYMLPSLFVQIDEIPLTPNGKVDRRALPRIDLTKARLIHYNPPRTPTEEMLVGIWCEVLKLEQVGIRENFFDLGGHSLLATQVASRIRESFKVEFPLKRLFELTTIADIAVALEAAMEQERVAVRGIESRKHGEYVRLSFAQQRMWFLDQFEPGSPLYNIPAAFRIYGDLNIEALKQALADLSERHSILRTIFIDLDGEAFQKVENIGLPLTVSDLSGASEDELLEVVRAEARSPFNLSRGSLARFKLFKLSEQQHLLMLTFHHIISDGWSFKIILNELCELYSARCEGRKPNLAPLPISYADFVLWQRELFESGALKSQMDYWCRQLRDLPVLQLPADRPRPAVQSYKGAVYRSHLGRELTSRLRQLSKQEGVTLFMTLLAGFQTLLYRYTEQTDIAIGTPIAGRNRFETEGIVGLFVNTLVLRIRIEDTLSFRQLLKQVRETALKGYANQDLPFEKLVEQLQPERNVIHSTLFQVMFALEEVASPSQLHGLSLEQVQADPGLAKFDLTLNIEQSPDTLICYYEYNTDLFDEATIAGMASHYQRLLESACADPETLVSRLEMLPKEERALILDGWSQKSAEPLEQTDIATLFELQVERTPDAPAIVFGEGVWNYRQLHEQASTLAHHLCASGLKAGQSVGIFAERSLELVTGLLGIWKAGGVYVPIDPDYPRERISWILQDSGITQLLVQSHLTARLPDKHPELFYLDTLVALERCEFLCRGDSGLPAYIIYTSGSTGRPKGVVVEQRAIANHSLAIARHHQLGVGEKTLLFSSPGFDVSLEQLLPSLVSGACVYIRSTELWSVEEFWARVEELGLTVLDLPTSYWHQLVQEMVEHRRTLPDCLRLLTVGGEAMSADHLRLWQELTGGKVRLYNAYGPTEAVVTATLYETPRDVESGRPVPIGRSFTGRRVYVLDRHSNPLPAGIPGELYLGGELLARGYLNLPEQTAEAFLTNPFVPEERYYRTGDRVRFLRDGNLEFLGRLDEQVKIRGFRIELTEIERVMAAHPQVSEAVVLVHGDLQKRLIGYVVASEGLDEGSLMGYLKERLPAFMIPQQIVFLERFPTNTSGKVDRKALPLPEFNYTEAVDSRQMNPVEQALAEIWAEVLQVDRVGLYDNFFQLGGDSILSIQIVSRAAQAGIKLTPKQLFQHQSIAELAKVAGVVRRLGEEHMPVVGSAPLTPVQKWFFEQCLPEPNHWNQSFMLQPSVQLQPAIVEETLRQLIRHHDALRTRFYRDQTGWRQLFIAPDEQVCFENYDLKAEPAPSLFIEEVVARLQSSLNIAQGPLLRAALFDLGEECRLFITIHHLVVDAVSWRILLEDFQRVYESILNKQQIKLPPKTTSFRDFSLKLHDYSKTITKELSYWQQDWQSAVRLPRDLDGENTEGSVGHVRLRLGQEATELLLHMLPANCRVRTMEAILTALYLTLSHWTGGDVICVDLEGHGREEFIEGIDLTRTVGWFTSIYPILLKLDPGTEGGIIGSVKDQLRRVPQNGLGYGILRYLTENYKVEQTAEISFNYFGQFDQQFNEYSLFRPAPESVGSTAGASNPRAYLIDVNCLVLGGELETIWSYSQNIHRRETVERLARGFLDRLEALVYECLSLDTDYSSISDFPLIKLDWNLLSGLLRKRPEIREVLPLLPAQEEMLMHTEQGSDVYFMQIRWQLEGYLQLSVLKMAWHEALARYQLLQTAFISDVKVQVYLASGTPQWQEYDLRCEHDPAVTIAEICKQDRQRGFDLAQVPLTRFLLFRTAEHSYELVWSFPHLLMDGWSTSVVLAEVRRNYEAAISGKTIPSEPACCVRDYAYWYTTQDSAEQEGFWRAELSAYTRSGAFDLKQDGLASGGGYYGLSSRLEAKYTTALNALAKQHQLTLGTLVQAAWALLLSLYGKRSEVIFGLTFSGRTVPVRGIESMVGLFINTLPIYIQLDPEESLFELFVRIREQQLRLSQYEYTSIELVRRIAGTDELFSSVLRFQNYPKDFLLKQESRSLEWHEVECYDIWHYPISLSAIPDHEMLLWLTYSCGHFRQESVQGIMETLRHILRLMAEDPFRTASALLKDSRVVQAVI